MEALEQLGKTLNSIGRVALAKLKPGDLMPIQGERLKLLAWIGGEVAEDDSSGDRIVDALIAFDKHRHLKDLRQARLVCYGCTQAYGDASRRLIDEHELFLKLLDYVARHAQLTRPFRKCFRGLMNGYFAYDTEAAYATGTGRMSWEALRNFLHKHKDSLAMPGYTPEWINTITAHGNLLTATPCEPYLNQDSQIFDEVCERLEISDDSWLVRTLLFAQVDAATRLDDTGFKERIDEVLLLLHDHPLYAHAALTRLLDRYARCAEHIVAHDNLRDYAVAQWGSPWLGNNAQNWLCTEPARDMVTRWLKHYLLQQFFTVFSEPDAETQRRMDFWDLYCEDLQGMYFALGNDAFGHGNQHHYKFRHDAKGLVARLSDTRHNLHAFIMQFKEQHVVEFNRQVNVAYFYSTKNGTPAFYLSKGWVEVGALSMGEVMKDSSVASGSKPIQHQDSKSLTWEGRFAQEVGMTANAVRVFCQKHACRHEDRSTQDGKVWMKPLNGERYAPTVASVLLGWGFTWSPEQKAYFKTGNPVR